MRKGGFYRWVLLVVCAVALAARALWVSADAVRDTYRPVVDRAQPELERRRKPTPAADHYSRYASLKQYIAPKRGILGFVAQGQSQADEMGRYRIARYALAPLVITHSTDSATIIADFPDELSLWQYIEAHNYQIRVYDSATGLAILNNPERHTR